MNDGGDHTNSTESKENEIENILDVIYSEASTAACSSNNKLLERIQTISFPGRYVTTVVREEPFEVAKRFVRPQLAYDVHAEPNADSVVAKIFNVQELGNTLLVITPTANVTKQHCIHGFVIDEKRHLGVTTLTTDEKDLLEYTQRPNNYSIVYSSGYIALSDAFIKSNITQKFFDMLQHKSKKPFSVLYYGNEIILTRRRCKTHKNRNIANPERDSPASSYPNKFMPKTPQATPSPSPILKDLGTVKSKTLPRGPLVGNKLKTPNKSRCTSLLPSNKPKLRFNPTQIKSHCNSPVIKRATPQPLSTQTRTRTKPDRHNSLDRPSMKTRTGNHSAPKEFRSKKHTPLQTGNNNISSTTSTSTLNENATYWVVHSRSNSPTIDNGQGAFESVPVKKNSTLIGNTNKRIHSILRNRTSSPGKKESCHKLERGKRPHVVFECDFSARPVRKSSDSFGNGLLIRSGIHSILKSRSSSRVKKETHSSELRKTPRIAFGGRLDRTRSILESRSGSPVSKGSQSSARKCRDESCNSANENVRKKRTTSSRTSKGVDDLKIMARGRSSSPKSNENRNNVVGIVRKKRFNNCGGDLKIKTSMAVRSNKTILSDSSTLISSRLKNRPRPVRRTAAMMRTSSSDSVKSEVSVYATPMGTSSNSPVRAHNNGESQVSIDSDQIQPRTRTQLPFNTYSQSSCEHVGDGMAQTSMPDEESFISIASNYSSFLGAAVKNSVKNPKAEQEKFSSIMALGNFPLETEHNERQDGSNDQPKFVKTSKEIANELERARLLMRERMWNFCPRLNSKRKVNFNLEEKKAKPEAPRRKTPEKRQQLAKRWKPMSKDGIKVLWPPHQMCESEGDIHLPTKVSEIQFEDSQTILKTDSSFFEQLMEPVRLPTNFSQRANEKLRSKLNRMNTKLAFENLGRLVERINARPIPQNRQLLTFFRIAELLDIKLYTRIENPWPNEAPTLGPRCRIDCYMFDDCKDLVLSIGMLKEQLNRFTEMFPGIKPNIRHIDNAFELTILPTVLTECIRKILVSLRARGLFDKLAEMAYKIMHPRPGTLALPKPKRRSNPSPNNCDQKRKKQ